MQTYSCMFLLNIGKFRGAGMRFEVFVLVKIWVVYWVVMLCDLVGEYHNPQDQNVEVLAFHRMFCHCFCFIKHIPHHTSLIFIPPHLE
jgi:hypothetical protein